VNGGEIMPIDIDRIRRQAVTIRDTCGAQQEQTGKLAKAVVDLCDELARVLPTVRAEPPLDKDHNLGG
jgi:hypothetical protein